MISGLDITVDYLYLFLFIHINFGPDGTKQNYLNDIKFTNKPTIYIRKNLNCTKDSW